MVYTKIFQRTDVCDFWKTLIFIYKLQTNVKITSVTYNIKP